MKLDFVKLSPTRNTTILVTTPVERAEHAAVAEKLMAYDSVQAEQVGFLEAPSLEGARMRLQMMGGEFCGNATMSLGAFRAYEDGLADGACADYPLEVSGAEGIVSCRIKRQANIYAGTVSMPLPERICEVNLGKIRCPAVFFDGIAHAIVPAEAMDPEEARDFIAEWCGKLDQDALGILLRSENSIKPLVYVRETDSAVWEQGCGSGTAALGAYEAWKQGRSVSIDVAQPGGVIRADVSFSDSVREISITGRVRIAAMGTAWIE